MNSSILNWLKLSGHENCFMFDDKTDTLLKEKVNNEYATYKTLNETKEPILEFLPKFYNTYKSNENYYIELENLLKNFKNPNIIDIKLGCRTFLESEVLDFTKRPDLYKKLIQFNKNALTEDENKIKSITKLRYMTFKDNLSSSARLCFRIDAFICKKTKNPIEFSYLRTEEDIKNALKLFLPKKNYLINYLLKRLHLLKSRFKKSEFFKNHEVIDSNLLIIYDDDNLGVWMIGFNKTIKLPLNIKIDHKSKWVLGNHEDGYLNGLDNLIKIIQSIVIL